MYGYVAAWQQEGIFGHLNGLLRRRVLEAEGRDAGPGACVLGARNITTSTHVPTTGQVIDAGRKIADRRRHLGVDTLGLLPIVRGIAPTSATTGGIHLLCHIAAANPRMTKAWAEPVIGQRAIDHGARLGIHVAVLQPDPGFKGFEVISGRRAAERTSGRLMHYRRLARDDETHPPPLGSHDSRRDDRPHKPAPHPRIHPQLA